MNALIKCLQAFPELSYCLFIIFTVTMKIALSCFAVLLFVATNTSAILVRRPSSFGDRYVVYGNTEFIACPAGLKCLPGEHHQTSYYLDSRRGRIKIQSNENGVSRENLYLPNGNTFIKVSYLVIKPKGSYL